MPVLSDCSSIALNKHLCFGHWVGWPQQIPNPNPKFQHSPQGQAGIRLRKPPNILLSKSRWENISFHTRIYVNCCSNTSCSKMGKKPFVNSIKHHTLPNPIIYCKSHSWQHFRNTKKSFSSALKTSQKNGFVCASLNGWLLLSHLNILDVFLLFFVWTPALLWRPTWTGISLPKIKIKFGENSCEKVYWISLTGIDFRVEHGDLVLVMANFHYNTVDSV